MAEKEKTATSQGETVTETRPKVKQPPMFKVMLLNDDYTTMEFVVHVLQKFFQKSLEEANQIMLHVHHKGMGVCGLYPFEIAETKVVQVVDYARKNDYPLQCTLEEA
jgi:ATP-dependent Clp protease adaptor protein ClpS